jgi:hypothetical protein
LNFFFILKREREREREKEREREGERERAVLKAAYNEMVLVIPSTCKLIS